jgi:hypothetical protein
MGCSLAILKMDVNIIVSCGLWRSMCSSHVISFVVMNFELCACYDELWNLNDVVMNHGLSMMLL